MSDGSKQAWASLADQFSSLAQQFRQHYERISAEPDAQPEPIGGSVEQAVDRVGKAIEDTAKTLNESIRDPQVRQDGAQTGTALLRAVGATLSDLGAALQRQAEPKQPTDAPEPKSTQD